MNSSFMCVFSLLLFGLNSLSAFTIVHVPQDYSTIQSAITAANAGDTIIVVPGKYKENITIDKALYLWSEAGLDSTTIEDPAPSSSWGTPETIVIFINRAGYGEVVGFTIIGNYDTNGAGVCISGDGWLIKDCMISNHHFGIKTYDASTQIIGNAFVHNILAIGAGHHSELTHNTIIDNEDGIYAFDSTRVYNNLVANSFVTVNGGSEYDSPIICNNVITSIGWNGGSQQYGVRFNGNDNKASVKNNIIVYCGRDGIFSSYGNLSIPGQYQISYNDVFDNSTNYNDLVGDRTGSEGNICTNPLFCDNDNLFYLASNSPCIDKGDSTIFDIDGSRSDIGMYGGLHTKDLRYAPSSFNVLSPEDSSVINPSGITLKWDNSFDRDAGDQVTYRIILGKSIIWYYPNARHSEFKIDMIQDTLYTSTTQYIIQTSLTDSTWYFWDVEAIDNSGLFKRSNTIHSFFTSSTINNVESTIGSQSFKLYQNYPNPFNPSTTIQYSLPNKSFVKLNIYNTLGQVVAQLISQQMNAGTYAVEWHASGYASGIYYYRIEADNYIETKKFILLR